MTPARGGKLIVSKSKRCGLLFPVARVHRLLKSSNIVRASRVSLISAVYLTAVLEYLTSELIDLAGSVTKTAKYKTISPRFIMLAAHSDEELLKTLSGVTIPFSGSSPFIHPVLLPKKKPQRNSFCKVKAKVLHSIKMPFGQVLQILQTDIADLNVDAVINPTNERLYMGGMVGSRLMAVGGSKFAKVIADARSDIQHLQKLDGT
uniref:Histone H2A n=1 Tax=Mesocestoides corti TaxID=53468 RepID=A0A5K3F1U1_MESCO